MTRPAPVSSKSCPRCVIKYRMSVFRLFGRAAEDFRNRANARADSQSEFPGAVFGFGRTLGFERIGIGRRLMPLATHESSACQNRRNGGCGTSQRVAMPCCYLAV